MDLPYTVHLPAMLVNKSSDGVWGASLDVFADTEILVVPSFDFSSCSPR